MPDELPVTDGAVETSESSVNWEQRYKDTHANWNSLNERFSRFEKDPSAVIEFLQEKHPDLLVGDEEEETEDEDLYEEASDPTAKELAQIRKEQAEFREWKQQQVATQGKALFEKDLGEVAGTRTVGKQGRDWIELQVSRGSNDRAALEKATKEWFEYEDGIKGPTRKPTPTPPQPGKAGEQDYNASKDPNARRTARRARIAAQVEAGMQEQ